jgi:hypothetical protein
VQQIALSLGCDNGRRAEGESGEGTESPNSPADEEESIDVDKSASVWVGAAQRRSTSSLGDSIGDFPLSPSAPV